MIRLDLKTALPKIRAAQKSAELVHAGRYSGPCALGAAMTPDERVAIEIAGKDTVGIRALIETGVVEVPEFQAGDMDWLQKVFDFGDDAEFDRTLSSLEETYQ